MVRPTNVSNVVSAFSGEQTETIKELLLRIETLEKKVSKLMGMG